MHPDITWAELATPFMTYLARVWLPDTGAIEPAGYSIDGGRTIVPLRLEERA